MRVKFVCSIFLTRIVTFGYADEWFRSRSLLPHLCEHFHGLADMREREREREREIKGYVCFNMVFLRIFWNLMHPKEVKRVFKR